jgi:predicted MFS family arabinose efflux permease
LTTLGIATIGQFGLFFILPIYLQNVLGMTALQTGVALLPISVCMAFIGPLSGLVASKTGPKWVVSIGMFVSCFGTFFMMQSLSSTATTSSLFPAFLLFGIGFGMAAAQMNNIILSSVPMQFAGEASAANATIRQVGTSVGVALIGVVLATTLVPNITMQVKADTAIPTTAKMQIAQQITHLSIESGQKPPASPFTNAVKNDISIGLVDSAKSALLLAFVLTLIGATCSLFIPNTKIPANK